jgi:hypothetical protein
MYKLGSILEGESNPGDLIGGRKMIGNLEDKEQRIADG